MKLSREHYIPAGCLVLSFNGLDLVDERWMTPNLQSWTTFTRDARREALTQVNDANENELSPDFQDLLFKQPLLRTFGSLFRAGWIDLELRIDLDSERTTSIRVYLLPDDTFGQEVDRSIPSLKRARKRILDVLDYSARAWQGDGYAGKRFLSLAEFIGADASGNGSLLQLFNDIPSPESDESKLTDPPIKDAVGDLMLSTVPGLKTHLYYYQAESAAAMVLKEIYPEQTIDPRLIRVQSQTNVPWYIDPVSGRVRLTPLHYDGIPGGILAEEMGTGKTIICLALILTTRLLSTKPPEVHPSGQPPPRNKMKSLADMAAAVASQNGVAWKYYFKKLEVRAGLDHALCKKILKRNPAFYYPSAPPVRRAGRRHEEPEEPPSKVHMCEATVIVVPDNLVAQWRSEILDHTSGLEVATLNTYDFVPSFDEVMDLDVLLFSQSRFSMIADGNGRMLEDVLAKLHFKRCIVDEGHKLGNSTLNHRSKLLIALNALRFTSRWVVTGTPSHGLFGVKGGGALEAGETLSETDLISSQMDQFHVDDSRATPVAEMEKQDLQRLGAITTLFLQARPWANTSQEDQDDLAKWDSYMLLQRHDPRSFGRWETLKSTLNSLIVRHRLEDLDSELPKVTEKVVELEGSYQDRLALNIFAMMIIFNSVQSQREDQDYFFHPKQKKSLMQIVFNLKQSSFFGGCFFTRREISEAVTTAKGFLHRRRFPISPEDETLLRGAINFGELAINNSLRDLCRTFHDIPVLVKGLPEQARGTWALNGDARDISSAGMLLTLQKNVYDAAGEPDGINTLLNGGLEQAGALARVAAKTSFQLTKLSHSKTPETNVLAGKTKFGDDGSRSRPRAADDIKPFDVISADTLPVSLQKVMITSTASAKLSYLINAILQHSEQEKIIIFYENDNVAWYLASMLDLLHINHLIYARVLKTELRNDYVKTFNQDSRFRVLLMDLGQAAFGLDMHVASRVYFINPVLNPQIQAQAIGRVRRIKQNKPVHVETLVLKHSIDAVIVEHRRQLSQAEHRRIKSVLDIKPIYNWIQNARIVPAAPPVDNAASQMASLRAPLRLFGKGKGYLSCTIEEPIEGYDANNDQADSSGSSGLAGTKRSYDEALKDGAPSRETSSGTEISTERPARRARFDHGGSDSV